MTELLSLPSHVGPQKMNGQGWYDEMNDHQVGWGNTQPYDQPSNSWYDEMDDESVGWGRPWRCSNCGAGDEMEDESVGYDRPSHTQAHRPDSQSVSNYYNGWRL